MAKKTDGIEIYHRQSCSKSRGGSNCTCAPSYRAAVWDPQTKKNRHSQRFGRRSDAVRWRADTLSAKHRQQLGPIRSPKLEAVADEMFQAIATGLLSTSSGSPFKPSTTRSYRLYYRNEIKPSFGQVKVDRLSRKEVQKLVDDLSGRMSPSSVRNALMPLRLIIRYAIQRDLIQINPMLGLQLPGKREHPVRVLSISEAKLIISTLEGQDRAIFATALLAGLRLGELRALRWSHVRFDKGIISVESSWDREEGEIRPKSRAGVRNVPLVPELDAILRELGPSKSDHFVLGSADTPFGQQSLFKRTDRTLDKVGLAGSRLHPCRHFFASMLIASGANIKEVQTYLGHASVQITLDRYSHLLGGDEVRAADRFSSYLASQDFSPARDHDRDGRREPISS